MNPDFEPSTLWRISAFDRLREQALQGELRGLERQTVLSTTLQSELTALERKQEAGDALEVIAACVRLQEPALVYLAFQDLVWPVTLFPAQMLYHSPRTLLEASEAGLATLATLSVEPAGVRPPGHPMRERIASDASYRPLAPVLWRLALHGPRSRLLSEIAGTAAYRVLRHPRVDDLPLPGALGPAADRLRREAASLRGVGDWPGMSVERGARLLNALYLTANLMVTRSHPAARPEPAQSLFGRKPR
jgi:hypothetical protein